jgi:hypothetical protein
MLNKLLIILKEDGYTIFCEDGITPMQFVDKTKTTGISDLDTAIAICLSHDYKYDSI